MKELATILMRVRGLVATRVSNLAAGFQYSRGNMAPEGDDSYQIAYDFGLEYALTTTNYA